MSTFGRGGPLPGPGCLRSVDTHDASICTPDTEARHGAPPQARHRPATATRDEATAGGFDSEGGSKRCSTLGAPRPPTALTVRAIFGSVDSELAVHAYNLRPGAWKMPAKARSCHYMLIETQRRRLSRRRRLRVPVRTSTAPTRHPESLATAPDQCPVGRPGACLSRHPGRFPGVSKICTAIPVSSAGRATTPVRRAP